MNNIDRYKEEKKKIEDNIKLLQKKLFKHKITHTEDSDNWGYVGDLIYINTQLESMIKFI